MLTLFVYALFIVVVVSICYFTIKGLVYLDNLIKLAWMSRKFKKVVDTELVEEETVDVKEPVDVKTQLPLTGDYLLNMPPVADLLKVISSVETPKQEVSNVGSDNDDRSTNDGS